jgi:hypothetical protein
MMEVSPASEQIETEPEPPPCAGTNPSSRARRDFNQLEQIDYARRRAAVHLSNALLTFGPPSNAELERLLSIIRTVLTRGPVSSLEAPSPLTEDDVPVAGDLVPHDRPVEPFVLPGAEDILVIEDVGLRSNGLWSSRPLPGGAARGNYRPM